MTNQHFFMREFSSEQLSHLLAEKVRELKTSKGQIEELNQRLQDTVAQLEEKQNQLVAQKENLEKEVKLKTQEIIKTEKLATIGELAARIAHDLRNPLSVVKNTTEILKINLENSDEKTVGYLNRIDRAIYRMQHQIDDVLDYVRPVELHEELTNFSFIIHDVLDRIVIPDNVTVYPPREDRRIYCDPLKIEIVFVNLIMNAIHATEGKIGRIDVIINDDQNDDFVVIQIKDSGHGIPKSLYQKIFDPLFTTRQIGTGLGLPSCKNILERHGGTIDFTSKVGKGTTFFVRLPKGNLVK
jgi:signal transduction histidine kinase